MYDDNPWVSSRVDHPTPFEHDIPLTGWIEAASWLTDTTLLVVGWFDSPDEASPTLALIRDDRVIPLEGHVFAFPRWDVLLPGRTAGKMLVVHVPPLEHPEPPEYLPHEVLRAGRLLVHTGPAVLELPPGDLSQVVTDLPSLVQHHLIALDATIRRKMLAFLLQAVRSGEHASDPDCAWEYHENRSALRPRVLSKNLYFIHEALRERLAPCSIVTDEPIGAYIDALIAVDDTTFLMLGWLHDAESQVYRATAVAPEGYRADLLAHVFRYSRQDIEQLYANQAMYHQMQDGFISYFKLDEPSYQPTGWLLEIHTLCGPPAGTAAAGPAGGRSLA